jgi:hypothetical protein
MVVAPMALDRQCYNQTLVSDLPLPTGHMSILVTTFLIGYIDKSSDEVFDERVDLGFWVTPAG